MQRIQKLEKPEGKSAELLGAVRKSLGVTPNMFTTMANSPSSLKGYLDFNKALTSGKLKNGIRESLALTVAGYNGCDYCASAHSYLGENQAHLSKEELQLNLRGRSSDQKKQAALSFARKLLEKRGKISQHDLDDVKAAGFGEDEVIEILSHVALNILTNYFNEAFLVEVDFPRVQAKETAAV